MKKIVITNFGVRECAILMKLCESDISAEFEFVTVGTNNNPFMMSIGRMVLIESYSLYNIKELKEDTVFTDVEFTIIGPEAPIAVVSKIEIQERRYIFGTFGRLCHD